MTRRRGRDMYHPLRFNEYSADELRIKDHMDNIENLRKKFITMKNAKPIIINGRHRTFTVKSVNNPYIDVSDYYINTSQRDRIRNKKYKTTGKLRIPVTRRRYDSTRRMKKPKTSKTPINPAKPKKSVKK